MLRLTTLGVVDLRDDRGHSVRDLLAQPKRVALLAYLAVEGVKAPVSRDRILALFWPESDEARARNALSQALHHLRQALGPGVIESEGLHTIGVRADRLWCDAMAFADALERGEAELALDLYRGEFCPALFVSGAPDLEHWLDAQRRRLHGQAFDALRTLARRASERGDQAAAARAARRALTMQPDEEADVRALLATLEQAGDVPGALQAYKDFERRLAREFETGPAAETRQLIEAMRRRRDAAHPAAPAESAPPAVEVQPARGAPAAPARPAPAPARFSRLALAAAAALTVLTVATIVVLLPRGRPAVAEPVKTLAVFPFTVRGGADLGYLREGVVDLLSAKLDGAAGFRAVDPRSVIAAAAATGGASATQDASAHIARRLGARWFIRGDLIEAAGRLEITSSLFDADSGGRAVATASVAGGTSDLFDLLDALTGRILAGMVAGRDTALTKLAAVTTNSLPALRAFLQGEQALRAGLDAQAGAAFREAAQLDTSFALAQYRLALTATWVSVPGGENPTVWAEAAARHAERLTPLGRDLLTAYRAYREGQTEEAERLYRGVIEGHPDNLEAWLMLGETLFHFNLFRGRPSLEAWVPFQRVLALDSTNVHALIHLARLAALEGRAATLDSLARRYLARYHEADRAIEMQALVAGTQGDRASGDSVSAASRRMDEVVAVSVLHAVLVYAQRPEAAAWVVAPFAAPRSADGPMVRHGRRILSDVGLMTGRWGRESVARLLGTATDHGWLLESEVLVTTDPFFAAPRERVVALRDSVAALRPYVPQTPINQPPHPELGAAARAYLLGLLSIRLQDTAAARGYRAELDAVRGGSAGAAHALAHGLRAEIARSSGDLEGALAEIEQFPFEVVAQVGSGLAHWGVRERFLRAEILHALGRDDEALGWYDSFVGWPDLPWLAGAHFRRGQIQARLGHREHARFHYGRFVRLWKNCDQEFRPLLDQATQALAQLGPGEATP